MTTAQKLIVASVVIIVLLGLLLLFARQLKGGRLRVPGQAGGRQRQPRLGIVDTFDLDNQRQLVLIRRDNVEHLLMVGGASDVVVESHIVRAGARTATPLFNESGSQDRPLPPFETLVPPSEPALRAGDELRRNGAGPDASDIAPALPTRTVHMPVDLALGAGIGAAGVAAAAEDGGLAKTPAPAPMPFAPAPMTAAPVPPLPSQAPSFARDHAPAPAVSPGELDDMARQLEAALKRPFSAVRPGSAFPEPSKPAAPPTEAAAAPAPLPPIEPAIPPQLAPVDIKAVAVKPPEVKPAAPVPEPGPAPVKPQAMLDMEAELEAALGLKPKPAEPRASEPRSAETKPAEARPVEAKAPAPIVPKPAVMAPPRVEPAAAPPRPVEPEIIVPPPAPKPDPIERPVATVTDEPVETQIAEPAADGSEPVAVEPAKPADAPKAEAAKELDPFSVDAIEAEFARLLGRDPKAKS